MDIPNPSDPCIRKNTTLHFFVWVILGSKFPGLWCWMELWRMARGGAHGVVRRDGRLNLGVLGKDTTWREGDSVLKASLLGRHLPAIFLYATAFISEKLPSRELTYPQKMAFWRWFSFSPRWDMLIPWRVHIFDSCCFYLSRLVQWNLGCFFHQICLVNSWDLELFTSNVWWSYLSRGGAFCLEGVGGLEMHDDMKVLYSPISCLHVFSFHFHLLVLKFLCLQFANAGRYSQPKWHCYLAESLLHPFLLAFQHVGGFRWERVGHVFHGERPPRSLEIK